MPHIQNGTKSPPFVCEDVARCEFCLRPSVLGCEHDYLNDLERMDLRREHEQRAARQIATGVYRSLKCQCHPDCTRTY